MTRREGAAVAFRGVAPLGRRHVPLPGAIVGQRRCHDGRGGVAAAAAAVGVVARCAVVVLVAVICQVVPPAACDVRHGRVTAQPSGGAPAAAQVLPVRAVEAGLDRLADGHVGLVDRDGVGRRERRRHAGAGGR